MNDTASFQALAGISGFDSKQSLAPVERRLEELVAPRAAEVARPALATLRAGGKRLRPVLVMVCGNYLQANTESQSRLVSAAAAVELVHMATLVHDDVLDRADLRRGLPTVFATDGRELATSVGDLLFAIAFDELSAAGDARVVEGLSYATSGLARGELIQREDAWNTEITRERYELRCELKTARLFEAAALMGAYSGDRAELAEPMREFGHHVGIAFQMADDVLDVIGKPSATGKACGTDLLDGTVNLPLIVARQRDHDLAALDLRTVTTPQQAAIVCDRIAATGACDAVLAEARASVETAKAKLAIVLGSDERAVFDLIADQAVGRSL